MGSEEAQHYACNFHSSHWKVIIITSPRIGCDLAGVQIQEAEAFSCTQSRRATKRELPRENSGVREVESHAMETVYNPLVPCSMSRVNFPQ